MAEATDSGRSPLRMILTFLFVGILPLAIGLFAAPRVIQKPRVGLIRLSYDIFSETAFEVSEQLALARDDASIRAVVLIINSPGGSAAYSEELYLDVLHTRERLPVVASIDLLAASGAYYIAVAADEIYADKASLVGSIGVLMDGFGFVGTMEKLGVERRLLTAGDNKGMLDPFSPADPVQTGYAKAMLDQIHQQFIDVVKQGRGARLKETPQTFSGLFWNGEEAVKLGLVDKLGNLDHVAREVVGAPEIIDYTPHDNLAERFAKRFGAAIGEGAVRALRSIAPIR